MPIVPLPAPRVLFAATARKGVLRVTRTDLVAKGSDLWLGRPRSLATLRGLSLDDQQGFIPPLPLVSPDGTRLALTVACGRRLDEENPTGNPLPVESYVVLVLDARNGRRLGRAEFEGRVEYAWNASSRALGILARDHEGKRSSVYVLKEGERRRRVREHATRFFWAGDALLTATWVQHGRTRWRTELTNPRRDLRATEPALRRHERGRVRSLSVRAAEREIGMPGAGPLTWLPDPLDRTYEPPRVDARERSVLLSGPLRVTSANDDPFPNGENAVGKVAAMLQTEDRAYVRGRRYRIVNEGFSFSDSSRSVTRRWNLGRGIFAYHSEYALFGGDPAFHGFGAIEPRTGRKRLWYHPDFHASRCDVLWR